MRRLESAALCFIATFVCAAILVGPARAAEIGQCRQLTKGTIPKAKHGKYADANCLTLFEKKGVVEAKGPYEWFPGPAPSCVHRKHGAWANESCTQEPAKAGKGSFEREPCYGSGNGCAEYGSSSTTAELETAPFSHPIECAPATDVGEITGAVSGFDTVTLRGCTDFADLYTCADDGSSGSISTFPLDTALTTHGGSGGNEVWYTLTGTGAQGVLGTPALTNVVTCQENVSGNGVLPFIVDGSASGVIAPLNVMSSDFVEVFGPGVGAQNLRTYICPDTPCLELPDVLTMRALVATNAAYEIKP